MGAEWLRIGVDGVVPVTWEVSKAAATGSGTISGWASVFNVIDHQDDIVVPGAFKKTISEWRASGRTIPLALDHEHTSEGIVGSITDLAETSFGLKFGAKFSSVPRAQEARTKALEKDLSGLSVFGPVIERSFEERDGRSLRILRQVGLMEISLTGFPANDRAMVTTVKGVLGVHRTAVRVGEWDAATHTGRLPDSAGAAVLASMYAAVLPNADLALKAGYDLPHHLVSLSGQVGPANVAAVRAALALVPQLAASDAVKEAARRHLQAHLDDFAKSTTDLPQAWIDDMRSALAITVASARKAAVDVLVRDQYAPYLQATIDETVDDKGDGGGPVTEPVDDASKYALSLIGQTGAGAGSRSGDTIDDLIAGMDAATVSADLDSLAAELGAAS